MDITKAQFADFNNTAGKTTFSYAQLLAQLKTDIGGASQFTGASVGMRRAGAFSVPVGFSGTIVSYDVAPVFDDLAFFNVALPTRLTIPVTDPPISRVAVSGLVVWSPTLPADSAFYASILRPSRVSLLESQQTVNGQGGTPITSFCNTGYIIDAIPGDFFELRAYHLLSSTNVNVARAEFMLTVLR